MRVKERRVVDRFLLKKSRPSTKKEGGGNFSAFFSHFFVNNSRASTLDGSSPLYNGIKYHHL